MIEQRLKRFAARLKKLGCDSALISGTSDVRYLSGFTGDDSWLVVSADSRPVVVTDSRYTEQARTEAPLFKVHQRSGPLAQAGADMLKRAKARRVAFDPDLLTVRFHNYLKDCGKRMEFVPAIGLLSELRQIKDADEIKLIRTALRQAEAAFLRLKKDVAPGVSEMHLANQLEIYLREAGAAKSSFETIVAYRERASLAHARPTERLYQKGEPVLVDWGAMHRLYCSDLTRVIVPAKIASFLCEVYQVVLEAQQRAIRRIKPGAKLQEVDAAARDYIRKAGYGGHFGHGLGHGVGLDIHEAPYLNPSAKGELRPGMVFTVEPGIYLAGRGGVRIEDMVLVTRSGCEVLSHLENSL